MTGGIVIGSRWTAEGAHVVVTAVDHGVVWVRDERTGAHWAEVAAFAARTWTRRRTTLTGMPAVEVPAIAR